MDGRTDGRMDGWGWIDGETDRLTLNLHKKQHFSVVPLFRRMSKIQTISFIN